MRVCLCLSDISSVEETEVAVGKLCDGDWSHVSMLGELESEIVLNYPWGEVLLEVVSGGRGCEIVGGGQKERCET